jgi:hypothetical protein
MKTPRSMNARGNGKPGRESNTHHTKAGPLRRAELNARAPRKINYFSGYLRIELIPRANVTVPPSKKPAKGGHAFVVRRGGSGQGYLGRALADFSMDGHNSFVATHVQTPGGYKHLKEPIFFNNLAYDEIHLAVINMPKKGKK